MKFVKVGKRGYVVWKHVRIENCRTLTIDRAAIKFGVMQKGVCRMNDIEQLQKLFSKHLNSGLCIKTDEGGWEIDIYENIIETNIPSGAIVLASNGCNDLLYIQNPNDKNLLNSTVYVFWHEEKVSEKFIENIDILLNPPQPKASEWGTIYYYGGEVKVELGDEVSARELLFRKVGRVSYLPGISKKHRDFEHHGLAWIGISFPTGSIRGAYIDPEKNWVKKGVRFQKRSSESFHEIGPGEDLDK